MVEQITLAQWGMELPADFARRDSKPTTLREIVNYHAYDDAWVPDMLAGRTMEEAGREVFKGVEVPGGAPLQDRLVALTGRQP